MIDSYGATCVTFINHVSTVDISGVCCFCHTESGCQGEYGCHGELVLMANMVALANQVRSGLIAKPGGQSVMTSLIF